MTVIFQVLLFVSVFVSLSYILAKHISLHYQLERHRKKMEQAQETTFRTIFDGIQVKGRFTLPPKERKEEVSGLAISLDSICKNA